MGYPAQVFNVMIASPGDVASERAIARDVIYEWNAVHSAVRGIVLLPIGWDSHSSPEMGGTPQQIINRQVLEKCDLLVGVFWTRAGTPTTEYASGTIEEIERHVETGSPAMLYFSSQPVALDSVDMAQVEELRRFREACRTRGLYESYDSHAHFREKFYRHLQLKVNEHALFASAAPPAERGPAEPERRLPSLSPEARVLLKEASLDPQGEVVFLRHLGGTDLQVNGKDLIDSMMDRRTLARWEAALEELVREGLLLPRGTAGEVFGISARGYEVADMIEL